MQAQSIHQLASEAAKYFVTAKRGDGTIITLKDDRPDWVQDLAHQAHGDFMPDDWRYEKISSALDTIVEAGEDADLDDLSNEWADSAVDIYTSDRLAWLASNLNRAGYCDEGASEFGISDDQGIIAQIGIGQYTEASEIWSLIISALEDHS